MRLIFFFSSALSYHAIELNCGWFKKIGSFSEFMCLNYYFMSENFQYLVLKAEKCSKIYDFKFISDLNKCLFIENKKSNCFNNQLLFY